VNDLVLLLLLSLCHRVQALTRPTTLTVRGRAALAVTAVTRCVCWSACSCILLDRAACVIEKLNWGGCFCLNCLHTLGQTGLPLMPSTALTVPARPSCSIKWHQGDLTLVEG